MHKNISIESNRAFELSMWMDNFYGLEPECCSNRILADIRSQARNYRYGIRGEVVSAPIPRCTRPELNWFVIVPFFCSLADTGLAAHRVDYEPRRRGQRVEEGAGGPRSAADQHRVDDTRLRGRSGFGSRRNCRPLGARIRVRLSSFS